MEGVDASPRELRGTSGKRRNDELWHALMQRYAYPLDMGVKSS